MEKTIETFHKAAAITVLPPLNSWCGRDEGEKEGVLEVI